MRNFSNLFNIIRDLGHVGNDGLKELNRIGHECEVADHAAVKVVEGFQNDVSNIRTDFLMDCVQHDLIEVIGNE